MSKFLIRITSDNSGNIISLYSPDFGLELLEYGNPTDITNSYRTHVIDTFTTHLINHTQGIIPKTLKELKYIPLSHMQRWEPFEVSYTITYGFFAKSLPVVGHVTNILGILCGGFITFMALRIASSSSNNSEDSAASNSLSIFGTILSSIISVIIYTYSGATEMLTGLGRGIDQSLEKAIQRDYEPLPATIENNINSRIVYLRKVISLLAFSGISANTLIAGISTYQEGILLVDKYLDLYPNLSDSEREKNKELLRWLVINLFVLVGAYTALAFQGSFASKLVEELSNKLEQNEQIENQNTGLAQDEGTNNGLFAQFNMASSATIRLPQFDYTQEQPLPALEERQLNNAHRCLLM